jgi:hypothetical protein
MSLYNVTFYEEGKYLSHISAKNIDITDNETFLYLLSGRVVRLYHYIKNINICEGIITVYYQHNGYLTINKLHA